LGRLMRRVYQDRDEVRRRGAAGVERAQGWSWKRSADAVMEGVCALSEAPIFTYAVVPVRPDEEKPRAAPLVSLCMIVKDEQRVLADCLGSIKPWVDEIVLVDTGSTDRTVEIAEQFG